MSSIIHHTHCPVCDSVDIHEVLIAKDHTVSGESFSIWQCRQCDLRFTQDVPDQDSIGRYYKSEDYISHTNSQRGLVNQLYQVVRKRTLKQKRSLVERVSGRKNGNLLDVGSGVGAFVREMKDNGWNVTGLEPDPDARRVAKENFGSDLVNIEALWQQEPQSFDVITLWHVLEHVHALHQQMQQFKSLLTEKGRLIIAVPNYTSVDAEIYRENWAAYDVPRHLYHFSPRSMKTLIEKNGMQLLGERPMWFDAFYISLLSSRYRNGSTNWMGAALSAVRSNFAALSKNTSCSSLIYIISK